MNQRKTLNYISIRASARVDYYITTADLAHMVRVSQDTLNKRILRNPHLFPPIHHVGTSRHRRFLLSEVQRWLLRRPRASTRTLGITRITRPIKTR